MDHNDLASELFNFLTLRSGRQFLAKDEAKRDGWSQVIWDILHSSLSKAFTRRRARYVNISRIQGLGMDQLDGLFFSKASLKASYSIVSDAIGIESAPHFFKSERGDDFYEMRNKIEEKNKGNGISIVIIESHEALPKNMTES